MRVKTSFVRGAIVASVVALGLSAGAAYAQNSSAAIAAAQADWRALSHGINVAAAQPIVTNDGRHLTGSQVNYARVLINQAETADDAGRPAAALAYIDEAERLLHPAPRPASLFAAGSERAVRP
jgi:hypothetical protein